MAAVQSQGRKALSVESILSGLRDSSSSILDEFNAHTDQHFEWLAGLRKALPGSPAEPLPQSAITALMGSENMRVKKRRPARKAAPKKPTEKATRALRNIKQQPTTTRSLRKRTVSIAPEPEAAKVTPPSRRRTRASTVARQETPPAAADPATPETVQKRAAPETPDTVQKLTVKELAARAEPSPPDVRARVSRAAGKKVKQTAEKLTRGAKKMKAPLPAPKPRSTRASVAARQSSSPEAKEDAASTRTRASRRTTRASMMQVDATPNAKTPKRSPTPETPKTVVKQKKSPFEGPSVENSTPSARFAAAMAMARSPATVTKSKHFSDPALAPGSVTKTIMKLTGGVGGKGRTRDDLPPPRLRLDDSAAAAEDGLGKKRTVHNKRKLFRKGSDSPNSTIASKASGESRVESLVSPKKALSAPDESTRSLRKRKSEETDAAEEVASLPESELKSAKMSFSDMKKSVLSVSRQHKRRKPSKPAEFVRKMARRREIEHDSPARRKQSVADEEHKSQPMSMASMSASEEVSPMNTDDVPPTKAVPMTEDPPMAKSETGPKKGKGVIVNFSLRAPTQPKEKPKKVVPQVSALQKAEKLRLQQEQKAAEKEARKQFYQAARNKTNTNGVSESTVSVSALKKTHEERTNQQKQKKATAAAVAREQKAAERAARVEVERKKRAAEEARKQKAAEDTRLAAEERRAEERKRLESERKAKAERRKQEESAQAEKRKKEEQQQKAEKRKAEERRKAEAERNRQLQALADQQREKEERAREREQKHKAQQEKLQKLKEMRERRQKELLEEQKARDAKRAAEMAAAAAAAAASNVACANSYDLSGLVSDASSDEEDNPRSEVPHWATGVALQDAIYNQFAFTPNQRRGAAMFATPPNCDLAEIFGKVSPRYRKRTSSAHWEKTPDGGLHKK